MGKKNIVFNDYISQKERFSDLYNGIVFRGRCVVRPEALAAVDSKLWRRRYEQNSYHEYIRDNAKIWEYGGGGWCLAWSRNPRYILRCR